MLRLCVRVAPAQTLPRGERGPRLGRRICRPEPVTQSDPAGARDGLRRGFVFFKNKNLGSASRASPRSINATTGPGALFAPGPSLWLFSLGYLFCLHTAVSYPGPMVACTGSPMGDRKRI